MNIIVKPYGKDIFECRPDTSWERENKDIFLIEGINSIEISPVVFARISKAGKCISKKFISRYYDGINFGLLLYPIIQNIKNDNIGDIFDTASGNDEQQTRLNYLDHTSLLPHPLYNPIVLENADNSFNLQIDGTDTYSCDCSEEIKDKLENAITESSRYISLRIGDMVAVEISNGLNAFTSISSNNQNSDHSIGIRAEFCDKETISTRLIL